MNEIDLTDSRHILPGGYDTHRVTEPPAIPAEALAAFELAEAREELGLTRMLHAAGALDDGDTEAMLASVSGKLGRALRLLTGGALVLALAVVGLVAGPSGRAEAMEAPQPDPVARVVAPATIPVVLGAAGVTVRVRVTTPNVTPRGYHCSSVWSPVVFLGRACSLAPTFTVPVVPGRFTPLGRSIVAVTDDVAPMDTVPAWVVLDVRRPSRFGVGTWAPTYWGDGLTVTAPLYAYTASVGTWTPQQSSPVQVQELIGGRWVVRATLTTNRRGVASGAVILGGGLHTVRVARQAGATVWSTVGTAHTFYLVPTDVPVDIV